MTLTVNQACERLNNRLDTPLLFEGRRVKLGSRDSVCRQLYQLWRRRSHQVLDYSSFKRLLRFQLARDVTRVTMARDLRPWVAGGLTAAGLSAASLWYLNSRSEATENQTSTAGLGNIGTKRIQTLANLEADYPYEELQCGAETNKNMDGSDIPAVFKHWNNSCYFHSAMLMLYQMKDWFLETEPALDSSEYANAAPVLADLKFLIERMSKQDEIPVECFRTIYTRANKFLFPTNSRGCQEDTDSFLNAVFNRVKDPSGVAFQVNTQYYTSKEHIPLYYGGVEVPKEVIEPFTKIAERNEKGEIKFDEYTYDGHAIVKNKGIKKWVFMLPENIGQQSIPDDELTSSKSKTSHWTRLQVQPGLDLFENIRLELDSEQKCYTRCTNPENPDLRVRCLETTTYKALSNYFIVHLRYVREFQNYKSTLSETDIDLQGHAYTLIGVTFRNGDTPGSGHYTASIKIGDQWWYYDDLGPQRLKIEKPSVFDLWLQTLLFRRLDPEPK